MGSRRYAISDTDFRGPYDPGFLYPPSSIVRYQGSMWRSLGLVQGITPVEGPDWMLMVEKGATGPRGGVLYAARDPQPGDGVDGEFWINTATDFIFGPKADGAWPTGNSLVGSTGPSAYEAWLDAGNAGTETDFLADLEGEIGPSAYAAWLGEGNQGTEADFLADIKGEKGDPGAINRVRVNGTNQVQRGAVNFAASYFTGADDATNQETEITIAGAVANGAAGLQSGVDKARSDSVSKGHISGAKQEWVSGTSYRITLGEALVNGTLLSWTANITRSGLALAASTLYYVYLYSSAGAAALEESTTPAEWDQTNGYYRRGGAAPNSSRRCVGILITESPATITQFSCYSHGRVREYVCISNTSLGFQNLLAGFSGDTHTVINIPLSPVHASHWLAAPKINHSSNNTDATVGLNPVNTGGNGYQGHYTARATGSYKTFFGRYWMPLEEPQKTYVALSSATGNVQTEIEYYGARYTV